MKKYICIVDAYSTGAELAPIFKKNGWSCIHIQSSSEIPQEYQSTFKHETFDFLISPKNESKDEFLKIAEELKALSPEYIIPGTETGVYVADLLSSLVGTTGNSINTSALRRNKYSMQEALKKAGINSIPQFLAESVEQAKKWASELGKWPVVVKPVDSAGADSVRFCNTIDEVEDAFNKIYGKKNKLGLTNKNVLLQERLNGQQYIVNAVSINGQHLITEIWSDDKKEVENASLICEREILLPYLGDVQDQLVEYMEKSLTILGIENGPSHSELMMTDSGPVLIETAARMQGTIMHHAVVSALGYSHVTLTAERYTKPEQFVSRLGKKYMLKTQLQCITLASEFEGVVKVNNCDELLKSLPSYFGMMHTPKAGDNIYRTTDLFTNPGIIYLCHQDQKQIDVDHTTIRRYEKQGKLFELA
ncbi:ATP-grasp domain-containing protein [Pantoea sp. GM01]|uniref:ATP-grasp domain-containing protein n=1 Tax=Pantoea sp. GM01 TaxID=1144320 RepID=UPI0002714AEE|nr:ATP-grasp domain-containing protein [Pantoea sp. GM01]EJL91401.1 biotin carboxylase [Pantoea sp. GM01]